MLWSATHQLPVLVRGVGLAGRHGCARGSCAAVLFGHAGLTRASRLGAGDLFGRMLSAFTILAWICGGGHSADDAAADVGVAGGRFGVVVVPEGAAGGADFDAVVQLADGAAGDGQGTGGVADGEHATEHRAGGGDASGPDKRTGRLLICSTRNRNGCGMRKPSSWRLALALAWPQASAERPVLSKKSTPR